MYNLKKGVLKYRSLANTPATVSSRDWFGWGGVKVRVDRGVRSGGCGFLSL